jgi:hypothetical protein
VLVVSHGSSARREPEPWQLGRRATMTASTYRLTIRTTLARLCACSIGKYSSLIAAFGDETKAVVMYDTDTPPVKDAPGAECLTVENSNMSKMRIIVDRLPFDAAPRLILI